MEADPRIAMKEAIGKWQRENGLNPAIVRRMHSEHGVCLKALALAEPAEVRKILLGMGVTDKSAVDTLVNAVKVIDKSWLNELKQNREAYGKIVGTTLPAIEAELQKSYDKLRADIKALFDRLTLLLSKRQKKLLDHAAEGYKEKVDFIKAEMKRFSAQIIKLEKALTDESMIAESAAMSCMEKRDALIKMHLKLALTEEGSPFVGEVRVNGSLCLTGTVVEPVIETIGKIDNCFHPNTPDIESCELFTHNSLRIFWTQTNDAHDSEITGFDIEYSRSLLLSDGDLTTDARAVWRSVKLSKEDATDLEDPTKFSLIIDGLRHGSTYHVRVCARNVYGLSEPSTTFQTETASIAGPKVPDLTVGLHDKRDADLKWAIDSGKDDADTSDLLIKAASSMLVHAASMDADDASATVASVITHYHIQYRRSEKKSWHSLIIAAAEGTDHRIEHLSPGKTYFFRVRARNKVDWSEWSARVELSVPAFGAEEINCSVVEHRDSFSKSFHPMNMLRHTDSPYASGPPDEFEADEADWIVFGTHVAYDTLTRIVLEQYQEQSDVKTFSLEVCSDLFKEDWVTVHPSPITARKLSDRQVFDLRPIRTKFKYIRLSLIENFQVHGIERESLKKKFVIRMMKFYGIPSA
jgi:hypothetical protein